MSGIRRSSPSAFIDASPNNGGIYKREFVGTTELPAYFTELADCGAGVLAWNHWNRNIPEHHSA